MGQFMGVAGVKAWNLVPIFRGKFRCKLKITSGCWLVGCFRFNGPLRQYFSLYRAVSQREGERKKK